ncbi:MAG: hypothetical protein FWG94_13610 [Oscillospiraceae bacterium]|nr:hypothetical protein [Oscillospiraceae bacterium]
MDEYGLLLDAAFCAGGKLVPSCKNLLYNHKNKNQSQSTAECVRCGLRFFISRGEIIMIAELQKYGGLGVWEWLSPLLWF